jgi:hypothetical protein
MPMSSDFIASKATIENLLFTILILPLMYDPEITTCRYKGLLQELVMFCYSFPVTRVPACSAKVFL